MKDKILQTEMRNTLTKLKAGIFPILKKGNAKERSNYHITALVSHASKVMLKILQARLQQYINRELPDVQIGLRRKRNQRSNCQYLLDHRKSESSKKTSTSALLVTLKPLTVWVAINCRKFLEMGIPDHLTCLLRNLYAGQEATVRIRHGITDWFKNGKGVCQGYTVSLHLFNLYTEY